MPWCDHDVVNVNFKCHEPRKWASTASSDVVHRRCKIWQLYARCMDPYVRIRAEAFKYIGNLGRERYDASSYRASAVAASKPISARRY